MSAETIAKLAYQVGYLTTGIANAVRDIREGRDLQTVLAQLDQLGTEAEASAEANTVRKRESA